MDVMTEEMKIDEVMKQETMVGEVAVLHMGLDLVIAVEEGEEEVED